MKRREKISVYQVLVRLFDNPNSTNKVGGTILENGVGKMNAFSTRALEEIKGLGCTHIWYTGLLEHATKSTFEGITPHHPAVVKGRAGSPYAITDYYDIAPELASTPQQRMDEFESLVERTHRVGMGVIMDFIPNHVSRLYHSDAKPPFVEDFGDKDDRSLRFHKNNNFYYIPSEMLRVEFAEYAVGDTMDIPYSEFPARATGNDQFHAHPTPNDWYETVKLNYGVDYQSGQTYFDEPVPDTWTKMLDILMFWAAKGVDGFRCDMAEMVPIAFWHWSLSRIRAVHPEILFIAEVYQPFRYQEFIDAGFNYLYDKVGLYDQLMSVLRDGAPAYDITRIWQSQEHVKGHMLHFMENHDEVRLASDFGAGSAERAFPAMALSALIDSGAVMTYFGQELGERGMDAEGYSGMDGRTTIFDYWSIGSMRAWIGDDHSYSGVGLSPEQRSLRHRYAQLLDLSLHRKAFNSGRFFDLIYVNSDHINTHDQYVFLRAKDQEMALVVVNFSDRAEDVEVFIPRHAFDILGITYGKPCIVQDLVRGLKGVTDLRADDTQVISLRPYDVSIHYYVMGGDHTMPGMADK